MTQKQKIIEYMAFHGSITTQEAFVDLGITRLAARIKEIEQDGVRVRRVRVEVKNRYGEDVTVTRYFPFTPDLVEWLKENWRA